MTTAAMLRYLRVPLRPAPLLLIVSFSLLLGLAARAGLAGLPLALILLSWFFKYAFVLLDHVADGAVEPPVLALEMVNPLSEQRPLALLILAILLHSLALAVGNWLGSFWAHATTLGAALLLPAVVAVQGATGSVVQSLDPRTCVRLVLRLRGDYLFVLAMIVLFWVAWQMVVGSAVGSQLPLAARIAVLMYAWLAVFAMIAGVLFERRLDLGLDAAHSPERARARSDAAVEKLRDQQIDRIYAQWRGGAHADAWQTISKLLQESGDAGAELRWLYRRAAHWPDQRLAERLARELLSRLLSRAAAAGEALDLLRERLHRNSQFRPASSAELLTLAQLARAAGDRPTARLLLHDFERFYPADPARGAIEQLAQQLSR